ncbi:hypothetical protein F4778DRAFT_576991 [Xylariomycetidae sp. FL2044]|nr:hypothetical protein F4778DRAFT_576991 [Xylariomycetidae sp. FL2044]
MNSPSLPHNGDMSRTLHYKALSTKYSDIRLLELKPSPTPQDPVVCRLIQTRLTPELEYIGLSTLYGDQSSLEPIYVDGLRIRLPSMTVQALKNVRTVFLSDQKPLDPGHLPLDGHHPLPAQASQNPTPTPAKKPPRWLKHLMRGVSSILPDPGRGRGPHETPLRVWLDLLDYMPLGTVYTFLREFSARQKAKGIDYDTVTRASSASSVGSSISSANASMIGGNELT